MGGKRSVRCGQLCAASPGFLCFHRLTAPQSLSYYGESMSPPLTTKMNNYQLIQHIKIRRALWDKSLWDRIDGSAREVMWGDVAEQMKTSSE